MTELPTPAVARVLYWPFLPRYSPVMPSTSTRTAASDTKTIGLFSASYCSALMMRGPNSMPLRVRRGMVPFRTHSSRVPAMMRRTFPR